MHAKPELAHRLKTSKMRRNSTSLNTCQRDVNIVTPFASLGSTVHRRWSYEDREYK